MAAQCQNLPGGALPPVSADFPCGPDLEEIGDKDFMNFLATMEGLLPSSAIRQIVADTELAQLAHAYETVLSIKAFAAEIERLALRRSGFEDAPRFDSFSSTIEDMRNFLAHAVWLHCYDLRHPGLRAGRGGASADNGLANQGEIPSPLLR